MYQIATGTPIRVQKYRPRRAAIVVSVSGGYDGTAQPIKNLRDYLSKISSDSAERRLLGESYNYDCPPQQNVLRFAVHLSSTYSVA